MKYNEEQTLAAVAQIAGESRALTFNFTAKLGAGDHLLTTGLAATATTLNGKEAATLSAPVLETGDAPKRVSVIATTPAAAHSYRVDVSARTQQGETLKMRARVEVSA